jgi:polyferredoxin
MACFIVPGVEAIITTIIQKTSSKEKVEKLRLKWLNTLLWGGVVLLMFEHVWHGEVVPWPPFLTAMQNPADVSVMLHEMATTGVAMAVAVTITWIVLVVVASKLSEKSDNTIKTMG